MNANDIDVKWNISLNLIWYIINISRAGEVDKLFAILQ